MTIGFGKDMGGIQRKYNGETNPKLHVKVSVEAWAHRAVDEWVHLFVHTLDIVSKNW